MTTWIVQLLARMPIVRKWLARIALLLLALIAWITAPLIAAVMYAAGGPLSRQRVEVAADHADATLNALAGNTAFRWLSEGAANNGGMGWRALGVLLEAGWPGHLDRYRR